MTRTFALLLAVVLMNTSTAQADLLTGKTINLNSTLLVAVPFGTTSPNAPVGSDALVGSNIEFSLIASQTLIELFTVDLTESGLVTINWTFDRSSSSLGFGPTSSNRLIFSLQDPVLTSFDLVSTSGVTGIDQSDFSFLGNGLPMVEIFGGADWGVGSSVTAQLGTSVIPLPAAVWLFASGLLGLIAVARGRIFAGST